MHTRQGVLTNRTASQHLILVCVQMSELIAEKGVDVIQTNPARSERGSIAIKIFQVAAR